MWVGFCGAGWLLVARAQIFLLGFEVRRMGSGLRTLRRCEGEAGLSLLVQAENSSEKEKNPFYLENGGDPLTQKKNSFQLKIDGS